jgi:hypothetical protein
MRLCRYLAAGKEEVALYYDTHIVSLPRLSGWLGVEIPGPASVDLLDYLPPQGKAAGAVQLLDERFRQLTQPEQARLSVPLGEVKLRVPIPQPSKVILLAGNYADHIKEGGGPGRRAPGHLSLFFSGSRRAPRSPIPATRCEFPLSLPITLTGNWNWA